jgi:hypothetical protein
MVLLCATGSTYTGGLQAATAYSSQAIARTPSALPSSFAGLVLIQFFVCVGALIRLICSVSVITCQVFIGHCSKYFSHRLAVAQQLVPSPQANALYYSSCVKRNDRNG